MKKIIAVVLMVFMPSAVAFAKDYVVNQKAGQYDVEVRIDKNPPVAGENVISVVIKDASGALVTDAGVKIEYSMPVMPGMPPMNYKADAMLKGNQYRTVVNLSMPGPWNIAVRIVKGGKTSVVRLNVDAH